MPDSDEPGTSDTGTCTSPKLMAPFQITRGMAGTGKREARRMIPAPRLPGAAAAMPDTDRLPETGDLSWIESKNLADKRTVLVKAPLAQVREAADDSAPVVFQAQQNVLLEVVEAAGAWLRVRHRDGQAGFVRVAQVWGA